MNNPSEISKEWYAYAERDLITAKHLVKTLYPVPLEIVCYHCQQSSEKFLIAFKRLFIELFQIAMELESSL